MKQHQWKIQRQAIPKENAQRKWDLAYQCLLKWAQETATQEQEAQNESCDLCASINARSSRNPDD
jgi:hypothetical protein